MLRKTISKFLVLFLCFTLFFSTFTVEAGVVSRIVTVKIVQKVLPSLIKNYGKRAGGHAEDLVVNFIKKNPKKQKDVFNSIDNYVKNNPLYSKNASLLKDKLSSVTPNLAKQKITIPTNGKWSGDVGNSSFWPNKISQNSKHTLVDLQKMVGKDGVPFKNGHPDFKKFRNANVEVKNMTGDHQKDVAEAAKSFVKNGKFKSQNEAKQYASKNDLAWHHEPDGKSMSLIPRIIHDNVKHDGGASVLRDAIKSSKSIKGP